MEHKGYLEHPEHEVKLPDPPDQHSGGSGDVFTALRRRSGCVERNFQKALTTMQQGNRLRDMAPPTRTSECWKYLRAAENDFRDLHAELQELAALYASLETPISVELQKFLARCPYELAHTIYYLGAVDRGKYHQAQPFVHDARTHFLALRDTIDDLQAQKLSSILLKRANDPNNAASSLTPPHGEVDDTVHDANTSPSSLLPSQHRHRPDSASTSTSSSASSASSLSSGASSRQSSPPSKLTSSSSSLLSPALPEEEESSLLSPAIPEEEEASSSSPRSSTALSASAHRRHGSPPVPVNTSDFTARVEHSVSMPMSNEKLLEYIGEHLEALESLDAVLVAGIADADDYAQEQSLSRRTDNALSLTKRGYTAEVDDDEDDDDAAASAPKDIRQRLIDKWECPDGEVGATTTGVGGDLVMFKGRLVCACRCGTCAYVLPLMLRACTLYWDNAGDRSRKAFAILRKIVSNAWTFPDNAKFRRVKLGNDAFQRKVASVAGAVDLLYGVGFERVLLADEGRMACYLSDERRASAQFNAGRVLLECVAGELSANVARWDSRDEVWFVTRVLAALYLVGTPARNVRG